MWMRQRALSSQRALREVRVQQIRGTVRLLGLKVVCQAELR